MRNNMQAFSIILLLAVFSLSWNAAGGVAVEDIHLLLPSKPISTEPHGSQYEGRQYVGDIRYNLEVLYGVPCFLEFPVVDDDRPGPFPSPEFEYMPLKITPETTLEEFLDALCSEEKLQWQVIHNIIHIWPTETYPDREDYLDTRMVSLDLQGVSVLDAVKAWASAVNVQRDPGSLGVAVTHTSDTASLTKYTTPAGIVQPGTVTLKVASVSAREALCAIMGVSREWVTVHYLHSVGRPDPVRLFASQEDIDACLEITPEERAALDAQEDLGSVLVEPTKTQE